MIPPTNDTSWRCFCSQPERHKLQDERGFTVVYCWKCEKVVQFECEFCGEFHIEQAFCKEAPERSPE